MEEPNFQALVYKGASEIAQAIGTNRREVPRLVKEEGLPAWKEHEKGVWKALPEELAKWLKERSRHFLFTKK